jgi:RecA/RadA recombinase
MDDEIEQLKKQMRQKKARRSVPTKSLLSTGSTLLDIACSGRVQGGFAKGHYFWMAGDSTSGKTFFSRTLLAEAANNPEFDDYRFIYDDVEGGSLMDTAKFFGQKLVDRIELPSTSGPSDTVEDFYYNVDDALKKGPCIYILDSMDALTSKQEDEKFTKQKNAKRKGKAAAGDYGISKAKVNSMRLRKILKPLARTGSILIIISQTRDNVGAMGYGDKKTTAGGRSLKFYAAMEVWTSVKERIKRTVNEKRRQIGITCHIKVKKNRFTGVESEVDVPIYWSYGIDNTGSMVDFLIDEKHWKKGRAGAIAAKEFEFTGAREKLIRHIEENNLEDQLKEIVGEVWDKIVEACAVKRKKRYA